MSAVAIEHGQGPSPVDARPMRVLTFTSLFPSSARPRHGIFVETRLRRLVRDAGVEARVVAPVPWFPFRAPAFGPYASFASTPRRSVRDALPVTHPRYLMLPKLGVGFQPDSMARAAAADIARWQDEGWRPDIIDAHYLYPDGVAAALLAERFALPFVVTARGTDVNVLARTPGIAERILWAARRASTVIAVSHRLRDGLVQVGLDASQVVVLRNGVDTDLFRPEDPTASRTRLGLPSGPLAICVGHLLPEKGWPLALEALARLPTWRLAFFGDGPLKQEFMALTRKLGIEERVSFRPTLPQPELRHVYSAADVMLLTSTREGWPNVVLESMACGTPVVAVDVGAVVEMITDPAVGRIVPGRDAEALAAAVEALREQRPDRARIRRHATQFGWEPISQGQLQVMTRAIERHATAAPVQRHPSLSLDAASTP